MRIMGREYQYSVFERIRWLILSIALEKSVKIIRISSRELDIRMQICLVHFIEKLNDLNV